MRYIPLLILLGQAPVQGETWLALNRGDLETVRVHQAAHDPEVAPLVAGLVKKAEAALAAPLASVVDKKTPAPGGDPHDYVSLSKYYWPDPAQANGLPYLRRDGESNPETKDYDADRMERMIGRVSVLAVAWAVTGREDYGRRAAQQIRTWFLDPATRMNPHLNFGQLIPGRNDGSPSGIIESRDFRQVADAATLLLSGKPGAPGGWTAADQADLTKWMGEYLKWLRTSKLGLKEQAAANNHGTWWDVQVVSLALFTGDAHTAREVCELAKTRRIAAHIEPDGRLPQELARTLTLDYSVFELEAQAQLAALAGMAGVDLWNYATPDGRGFRQAMDYLLPYLIKPSEWPHPQIHPPSATMGHHLLLAASRGLGAPHYAAAWTAAHPPSAASWNNELFLPAAREVSSGKH